jgi:hypothetical protein
MCRSFFAAMLLAVSATTQAAAPSISIGTLHDQLPPDTSRLLKRVRNAGDATAYVRVEVSRIVFDAQGDSREEPIDREILVRGDSTATGVVASPSHLIIPANGGQQATTLVHRGAREDERYYRVRFVPVVPETGEFSLTDAQQKEYERSVGATVNVLTGYGSVLIVPPRESRYATRIAGNVVRNEGNATVILDNLRVCASSKSRDCGAGIKVLVRPGRHYTVERAVGQPAHFDVIEGQQRREVTLSG